MTGRPALQTIRDNAATCTKSISRVVCHVYFQVWDHVVKGERMKIFHNFDKDSGSSSFLTSDISDL